jgi:tetratricopeptide (TPR) repeat protein
VVQNLHLKIPLLTVCYFALQLSPAQANDHSPQVVQAWKTAYQQKRDGDYLAAINSFTAILKQFPLRFDGDDLQYGAHLERAECYTGTSQFAKAVDDYNWCLGFKPKDEAAIFDRAEAYANWGKWHEAERDYAKSLELKPHDTDNRTRHAHALTKLKDYAGAIREYDTILKQTPEDDDVWRRRGDAELLQGDYKAAAGSYSKAIGYDPDVGWYFHYRAVAYEKLGKTDLAAKDRGRAQELNFKEKPGELERN